MRMPGGQAFHAPPLTPLNRALIIAIIGLFVLDSMTKMASGVSLASIFGLFPGRFLEGHIYQLITYPFFNTHLLGVIFNCLLLWFLGTDVEHRLGQKRYIMLMLVSIIGAGIVYIFMASFLFKSFLFIPLMGMSGAIFSLVLVYGINNPDTYFSFMFLFPIKARYVLCFYVMMELYSAIFSPMGKAAWAHLGAMAFGFMYLKMPDLDLFSKLFKKNGRKPGGGKKKRRDGPGLYIVKDGEGEADKKDPRYWQ
ncbi:MAG: rhomboid family intramembrane serine protease [Bacteriovoracaceae bacterium]|jgi:membrane associated rhomboid family serine protease|nr:rhomboid family intramembrane serine protease [Bacteriovoracaceae bacterium]